MTETTQRGPQPKPWIICLALAVLSLAVYVPALGGPFLWDDHTLIVKAPDVQKLAPIGSYFGGSFWRREDLAPGERTYFRPVTSLSFALDHLVHGNNPSGFHLTNIVLHAATACLLFGLLRRRGASSLVALTAGLAWAWFPRLSESTAWISGRTDIFAGLFSLLGLTLYERGKALWRWCAGLCFLVGLLAKEATLAGLLAAGIWSWSESSALRPLRARLLRLAPLLVALVAYLGLRVRAIGPQLSGRGLPWTDRVSYALEALGRYSTMLVDAWRPGIQLGTLGTPLNLLYVSLGLLALVLALALLVRFRSSFDAFDRGAVVMSLTSIGLVLHIVPIPVLTVAADRYLYLPTLGLVLLLTPRMACWLNGRNVAWRFAVMMYVLSFAPVTFLRAQLWSDEVAFWTHAFREQKSSNALSRLELGNLYARAGLFSRAGALFFDADPGDYTMFLMARNNAGIQLINLGRTAQAIQVLEDLVARAPQIPKYWFSLALAYSAEGRVDDAKKSLAEAMRLSPKYTAAQNMHETLTKLPSEAPPAYGDTVKEQLARADAAAKLNRSREAVQALLRASELGKLPAAEWEPALLYLLNAATAKELETLFNRYEAQQKANPVLVENFRARVERTDILRRLWPELVPMIGQVRRASSEEAEGQF